MSTGKCASAVLASLMIFALAAGGCGRHDADATETVAVDGAASPAPPVPDEVRAQIQQQQAQAQAEAAEQAKRGEAMALKNAAGK